MNVFYFRLSIIGVIVLLLSGCSNSDEPKLVKEDVSEEMLSALSRGDLSIEFVRTKGVFEVEDEETDKWIPDEAIYGKLHISPDSFVVSGGKVYYKVVFIYDNFYTTLAQLWDNYVAVTGFDKVIYVVKPFEVDYKDLSVIGVNNCRYNIELAKDGFLVLAYLSQKCFFGDDDEIILGSKTRDLYYYSGSNVEAPEGDTILSFESTQEAYQYVIDRIREKWGDTALGVDLNKLERNVKNTQILF